METLKLIKKILWIVMGIITSFAFVIFDYYLALMNIDGFKTGFDNGIEKALIPLATIILYLIQIIVCLELLGEEKKK